ncbi:MAG: glycosyltransferase [bacterium]|nr:glycosyltransferase [bacterium]
MKPDISVQVPVKNGGRKFETFLRCLAVQDIGKCWELIIIDDSSDIPLQEEFQYLLSELPDNCSVKVIRRDPGGNRPAARNDALEASSAPVGLLMDADLEFAPSLLRRHLEVRQQSGADVVMGRRVNGWSDSATCWQKWFDSRAMGYSPAGPFPWNYFITGNLSVTSALLVEAGGFDTSISSYGGEDTEMGYRLSKTGTSFYWNPKLSVNHLDDVSVSRHSEKMLEYGATGLRYTLQKHPDIKGLLGSRWIEPLSAPPIHLIPVKLVTRIALLSPVYRALLKFAEKHSGPSILFTYLAVGACLIGLQGRDYRR